MVRVSRCEQSLLHFFKLAISELNDSVLGYFYFKLLVKQVGEVLLDYLVGAFYYKRFVMRRRAIKSAGIRLFRTFDSDDIFSVEIVDIERL